MHSSVDRGTIFGSKLRVLGVLLLGIVSLGVLAVLLGVVGVPSVETVENRFAGVNESTTVVETDVVVNNPNPVGVSLGDTTINYTLSMNDVAMANGRKEGISVGTGNSTLSFRTAMNNDRIPPWWYSHVKNRERTTVAVDADVRSSLLGGRSVSVPQSQTVETDLISQFNSTERRPIDAGAPGIEDPVLYVEETTGTWDRADLSPQRTPIDLTFTVSNPKPWPYAVSELGYNITMNGVPVGEGSTEDLAAIPPGGTETIEAEVAIRNRYLDEWWVTHLERNQVTDLEIDFSLVVDPGDDDDALGGGGELTDVGSLRLPLEGIDYNRTIETDIFGTKNQTTASSDGTADGGDDGSRTTQEPVTSNADADGSRTTTAGSDTPTPTDGDSTPTPTDDDPTPTPTDSTTDDGLLGFD